MCMFVWIYRVLGTTIKLSTGMILVSWIMVNNRHLREVNNLILSYYYAFPRVLLLIITSNNCLIFIAY